jgi:hypothetical protein
VEGSGRGSWLVVTTQVMARVGGAPEVVLEATYAWYWAVDALRAAGARVHFAHPLREGVRVPR